MKIIYFFGNCCSLRSQSCLKHSTKWVNEVEWVSKVKVILWPWAKVAQISKLNVWLLACILRWAIQGLLALMLFCSVPFRKILITPSELVFCGTEPNFYTTVDRYSVWGDWNLPEHRTTAKEHIRDKLSSLLFALVTYRHVNIRQKSNNIMLRQQLFLIFMNPKFQFMIFTQANDHFIVWPSSYLNEQLCQIILKSMHKCRS